MDERVFSDRIDRMLEVFAFLPAYEGRGLFFVELEKLIGTEILERIIQRTCDGTRGRKVKSDDRRFEDLKLQIARAKRENRGHMSIVKEKHHQATINTLGNRR